MYNWAYIKNASLAKLDLDENDAQNMNLFNRFPVYANEVITQVCSSVKPKYTFAEFVIYKNKLDAWNSLVDKYPETNYSKGKIEEEPDKEDMTEEQKLFWEEYDTILKNKQFVSQIQNMPEDFISFGDDVCYQLVDFCDKQEELELSDKDFKYYGYNKVQFFHPGKFYISYNARWFTFESDIEEEQVLDIPTDILDCIPSYIASQCYKIDDERIATIYRNEYEAFLARIDNTNYKNTKTLIIDGGW